MCARDLYYFKLNFELIYPARFVYETNFCGTVVALCFAASKYINTGVKFSLQINIPRAKSLASATSKWNVKCLIKETKQSP